MTVGCRPASLKRCEVSPLWENARAGEGGSEMMRGATAPRHDFAGGPRGWTAGGLCFISVKERTTPSRKISMKPDLTLLSGGFTGHGEIKFTNLVPLPIPVDSTRSESFFSWLTLELSVPCSNRKKKSNQVNQTWSNQANLISNRGPRAGAQSLSSRA